MTWVILDSSQQAIVDEIERQTDRGAALVASAFLETRLTQLIAMRLHQSPDDDISSRVFKHDGALSSFSRKINMGYMLQLYPRTIWTMLDKVRDIRNDFAHSDAPLDFNNRSIADRSSNIEAVVFSYGAESINHWASWLSLLIPSNPKLEDILSLNKLIQEEGGRGHMIGAGKTGRDQFLNGIKFLLAYLT
jgi:hypothetical protein